MNFAIDGSTLEEGRNALNELEKYLKDRSLPELPSSNNNNGRQRLEDRKLLDHVPRNERLKHLNSSPIGLSLEELDDRGLIDGGGSLPSHSSSIQRGRRQMEMKQRSSRMRERESGFSKTLRGFFHIVRLLTKRGLNVEEYCRHRDPSGRGIMDRRQFSSMLRKLSLPFGSRELNEIKAKYSIANTDQVDYETMLRDAGVLDGTEVGGEMDAESMDGQGTNIGVFASIICDVRRMLLDSMDSLGKSPEEVYHMFSQWDSAGTGTVTATQFLRVLARMHVSLNDNDQDFLVELLDVDHMGRVYYDGILNFCFGGEPAGFPRDGSTSSVSYSISSPQHKYAYTGATTAVTGTTSGAIAGQNDDTATNNETVSMISQNASVDYGSGGAAPTSTGIIENHHQVYAHSSSYNNNNNNNNNNNSRRPHTASRVPTEIVANDHLSPLRASSSRGSRPSENYAANYPTSTISRVQRPLTASARVSTSYQDSNYVQGQSSRNNARPESAKQYVVEIADDNDVINDEYVMNMTPGSVLGESTIKSTFEYQQQLLSEDTMQNGPPGRDGQQQAQLSESAVESDALRQQIYNSRNVSFSGPSGSSNGAQNPEVLCKQYLHALRQAIVTRARGNFISDWFVQEIFRQFFDRDGVMQFQRQHLMLAFRELMNTDIPPHLAELAIRQLAMDDSSDHVTFSNFAVFVLDPDHELLVLKVQQHLANQFLVQGREYQSFLYNILRNESSEGKKQADSELSVKSFAEALNKLGNGEFSHDDLARLIRRFIVPGSGNCSCLLFLRMVFQSSLWKDAEKIVAAQEAAAEEAETIRRNFRSGGQQHHLIPSSLLLIESPEALEDFISMAEYLGIRLLSERHLHWIVHEALSAPLPENWTIQTSKSGDTYYFNKLLGKSQHAHPLDAYFFKLIDDYRASSAGPQPSNGINNNSNPGGYFGNSGNNTANVAAHNDAPSSNNAPKRHESSTHHSNAHSSSGNNISTHSNPSAAAAAASGNTNNVLQSLMKGSMPQQQPSASESSLRKKFAGLQSGVQTLNAQRQHQQQVNKSSKGFANAGYYDNFGRFHKAKQKVRPQSGNILNRSSRNDTSVVDRAIAISSLPHGAAGEDVRGGTSKEPGFANTRSQQQASMPRRAVSAGRIRPQSSNSISNNHQRLNDSTNVTKKLEAMYNSSVIGKLDAVLRPNNVALHSDKAKISLEHVPVPLTNGNNGDLNRGGRGGIVVLGGNK